MLEMIENLLRRMKGEYTGDEPGLYVSIVDAFQAAGLGERKDFLRFVPADIQEGDRPTKIVNHHLEFDSWKPKVGSGVIWHYIEELCASINAFQGMRYNRVNEKFARLVYYDTLNDPVSVMLEEFKYWLTTELSKYDLSKISACQTLKDDVQKRIVYVMSLERNATLRKVEDTYKMLQSDMTIFQLFIEIKHTLKASVIPTIDLEVSRQSSRDLFRSLIISSEKILKQGTRFLFFVFRDEADLSSNFSLKEIRHPRMQNYCNALSTGSGAIMRYFVATTFMQDVFPDTMAFLYSIDNAADADEKSGVVVFENLTPQNLLRGCSSLTPFIKFPHDKENINEWYTKGDSGFMESFRTKAHGEPFLRAHLLLMVIASYHQVFSACYDLSGEGGDILVYGAAEKEIGDIVNNYTKLLQELKEVFKFLSEKASEVHIRRTYAGEKLDTPWSINYSFALSSYGDLEKNVADCFLALNRLEQNMHELTLTERINRAKKKLESFKSLFSGSLAYQKRVLGSITSGGAPSYINRQPHSNATTALPSSVAVVNSNNQQNNAQHSDLNEGANITRGIQHGQ